MRDWKYYLPTFEYQKKLDDGGLPWLGHINFAYDLVANLNLAKIAELGTYKGTSLFSMAQSIKDNKLDSELFAIDCWEGDQHAGFYGNGVYETVSEITSNIYPESNVHLIRKYFDEAVNDFADSSIDLLHIDGLHTYTAVKHDFDTWIPKVKKNGIVMFHDICVKRFGVRKVWDELKTSFKDAYFFEFPHSFGLGVMFLDGEFKFKNTFDTELFKSHYVTLGELRKANSDVNRLKLENKQLKSKEKKTEDYLNYLRSIIEKQDQILHTFPHKIISKVTGK